METKCNYTLVGLFVVTFSVAFITLMIWLSIGLSSTKYKGYLVYMDESVAGLSEKAPVKYNGVDVGYVASVSLNRSNFSQAELLIMVDEKIPVTIATRAELVSQGLTGIGYIELMSSKSHGDLLKALPGQRYAVIPSEPSLFFRLDKVVSRLTDKIDHLSTNLIHLFDQDNIAALSETFKNLHSISANVNKQMGQFDNIFESTNTSMTHVAAVSKDLPVLMHEFHAVLEKIDGLTHNVQNTNLQANKTFTNATTMIDNFNVQLIPDVLDMLESLQTILVNVEQVSEQMNHDPSIIIRGKQARRPGPGEK